MDAVQLTGAPVAPITMSPADVAAHQAASYIRPARNASTDRAAVRSRICRDTIAQLSAMDGRKMTPGDFDRLAQAKAELAEITEKPAPVDSDPNIDEALQRAVARFRSAALTVASYEARDSASLSPDEYNTFYDKLSVMRDARTTLATAGQLHLIEPAA
ncbi:hypothetical protein [Streptomyces sp. ok210]|uniref:hypothetical protein n=1 Tax=Streptomyces sp. ok210 TaxID=1761905 RepID=UPI0008E8FF80|nr:hypothetical protein [Streptomyces sp. ok210]SFT31843.1 hypothetical protein SAMN04487982_12459 [Streptomyces sp. ok210]